LPLGILVLAGLAGPGASGSLWGQEGSFAYQIRGGMSTAVGSFRDPDQGWKGKAGAGASLSMGFTFPLHRPLGVYLGFSQHRFRCDEAVCPSGKNWVSTGFDVALRSVLGRRPVRPWLQAGFHSHRVEGRLFRDQGVKRVASDGGGGFEVGGGFLVKIGERASLSPGIRYGEGNVPFPLEGRMGMRYLVADLGLVVGF
jgi:hypothetical protein